jgi:bacillithiol synthase
MSSESVVVVTESLGGSTLSRAARAGQLDDWFRRCPRGGEWHPYAEAVRGSVGTDWFDRLAPAFNVNGAAASRLARSANGKGIVITTGQQPGLFGGPLMTFVKALSARALADTLQAAIGIPVAPVFWAATDDADFDEAATVSVSLAGGARELRLEHRGVAGTPMSGVALDNKEVNALLESLREACGSAPHASYLDAAVRAYRDGGTVGDAYVTLLRELLEPLEIAVIDASHGSVARAAEPVMLHAARGAVGVADAVRRRGEVIIAAGFSPQVEEVAGLSLVFVNSNGTKRRLPIPEASAFKPDGNSYLSSTVLLRPVMERAILPTAAYVGGPGEVAYFAQVTAVAAELGVPIPLVVPRWSATIIEPRTQRILEELGVDATAFADPHAVEGRAARASLPDHTRHALESLRTHISADTDALDIARDSLVSPDVIKGVRRMFEHRLERLERRFTAAVKRRELDLMQKIGTARGALYPHGIRQERKLAHIPFLARYGPQLIEQMLNAAGAHGRLIMSGSPSIPPSPASAPAPV